MNMRCSLDRIMRYSVIQCMSQVLSCLWKTRLGMGTGHELWTASHGIAYSSQSLMTSLNKLQDSCDAEQTIGIGTCRDAERDSGNET